MQKTSRAAGSEGGLATAMQSSPPPAGLPDPLSDELRWLRRLSLPLRAAALALFVNFVLGVVAANFPPPAGPNPAGISTCPPPL
jgi:hypothetical protein